MEEKQYGSTWMNIYTILFIIRIVSTIASVLIVLMAAINGNADNTGFALTSLILLIIEGVYMVFTFIHYSNKTQIGYALNMVYIFLSPFIATLNVLFRNVTDQGLDSAKILGVIITTFALIVVWSLPNYVYFKHRKYLFAKQSNNKSEKATSTHHDHALKATSAEIIPTKKESFVDDSQIEALKTLKELHEEGILSDEEFTEKKKRVLGI